MEKIMDSEKLQKLANLAIVRQHAASVTSSTNFNRKYINKVNSTLTALDNEFFETLVEAVGESSVEDTMTISKRLAEEKAKLKNKDLLVETAKEVVGTVTIHNEVAEDNIETKSETRPSIKTAKSLKKNETPSKQK